MTGSTPTRLGVLLLCSCILIMCFMTATHANLSSKNGSKVPTSKNSTRSTTSTLHIDLPVSTPSDEMSLESVFLFSRHGNRAADPIVEALCPKRKVLTDLYQQQKASYGALTYNGIRGMWDLGRFTRHQYMESGFIDGTYTRLTSQIRAAESDRTLISASAFGQTAYDTPYADTDLQIPIAVLTSASNEDNLLEVRKARCLERLEEDLHFFDQNIAQEFIDSHSELIDMVSNACGFDLRHGPELTNGEFSVMQLVKDLSDALTGDLLEGFPLMDGVTPQKRLEFLQFAEDIFKSRHYRTSAMDAYLSGNAPNRLMKLIDRRVSYNTNTTILDGPVPSHIELSKTSNVQSHFSSYRDIVVSDAKRLPIIRPRPPRRLFAWHAHREVLYGLKNFLKLDLGVEREGLPSGLIHPSTGIFFELWQNSTKFAELLAGAEKDHIYPALNPNRKNSQRYLGNIVDDAFSLRILLWVPCFPNTDEAPEAKNIKFKGKNANGDEVCLARVRTLPNCDNLEFCPLPRVKQIFAENFNAAGGDFRHHCRIEEGNAMVSMSSASLVGHSATPSTLPPSKARSFKSHTPREIFIDLVSDVEGDSDTNTEEDSLSVDDHVEDQLDQKGRTNKNTKSRSSNHHKKIIAKRRGSTKGAGWVIGETDEDVYNNQHASDWVNSLAGIKPNKQ